MSRTALRAVLFAGPLLIALGVVILLSVGDKPLLGTNRVQAASSFAELPPRGGQACTGSPEFIPEGTGEVVVRTSTGQAGPLDVTLSSGRRVIAHGHRAAAYGSGDTGVALDATVPRALRATVCVRNGGAKQLGLVGTPAGRAPPVRVDGKPVDAQFRIDFRGAERVSWWSRVGGILDRFADGKASFVGPWTLWLAAGLVLAAIALAIVALLRMERRGVAILCALVAVLNALAFSLTVPPFQVPDEESHVAYVQYLAETGNVPHPGKVGYSAEEDGLLGALQWGNIIGERNNRALHGRAVDIAVHNVEGAHSSRVGTGDVAGAVIYPPTFYAAEVLPYELSPTGDGLLDRLVWMRVFCALLAGATVLLVFGFLRELLPGTPWAWTVGALALALLPMFGFVSGGVQNDAGLYVCSAGLFWSIARILRRGLTPARGLALGGALVAGVLIKFTMVALAPAALATVIVALWRDRAAWRGAAVAAGIVAVPMLAYTLLSTQVWNRPLTGPLRASHPAVASPKPATIAGQISYAWELWLPRLPFMDDKFPGITPLWDTWYRGGIGIFGWLDYGFPLWVAIALVPVALAILVLAVRALASRARQRWADLGVYAVAVLGLMGLLAVVGYRYELRYETYFQSPRYLFALLPLFAATVALAVRGAGRRFGPAFGAAIAMILAALMVFAQLATLERYYG